MAVDDKVVGRMARLARLRIEAEAIPGYAADLSRILELVAQMDAAETDGVAPMAHPLDLTARLREDRVSETDRREAYQDGAPATADGLYLVPKVIDT